MLSKDWKNQIKRRPPGRFMVVSLGVEILVRPMTAARQLKIERQFLDPETHTIVDGMGFACAIAADSVVDEAGNLIFTPAEIENNLPDESGLEFAQASELIEIVRKFVSPESEKNSPSASDSPTVSR